MTFVGVVKAAGDDGSQGPRGHGCLPGGEGKADRDADSRAVGEGSDAVRVWGDFPPSLALEALLDHAGR